MSGWAALLAAAWMAAAPGDAPRLLYTEAKAPPAPPPSVQGLPELSRLAESVIPAVVGVVTTQAPPPGASDEQLRELFEKLNEGPRKGIGSGFVIHRDGWVLTNAHVVEGAEVIEVDLGNDGPRIKARVVGADAESDVALLKVDVKRPLPVVPLGDSDRVVVAEWVLVVGSPFGLDHTVTLGIVSHTGRTDIAPLGRPGTYDFIQTDASINPGNSGGPVVNLRGEVIGIATAVNATGQGIGFAVPINMAKEIVGQLRDRGRVVRSWLGVAVRERTRGEEAPAAGVVVTEVAAGGPAATAGVKVGDVITGFQGHEIRTPSRLRWYVSTAGVGREVELKTRRGEGPERSLRVSLAEVPAQEERRAAQARAAVDEGR
ncbi:trypsin-like peptidase domain-containing protein [Anaeromyxobacter sp. Fw109-5]|uniref:trypsin-like peptidase domain-containing protein n=1 Tax=Anaeromyxobacter sp. (strain Fw109-5) TaxID=404589 RepID=UPI0000ED7E73|nr:trypsin-like peptidase domain-containing protein [Anaeromyxobacter sp. Fw109-5]ABS25362.1 2-alkenal reductase [Anaeromyxobacter sp. Fw109-5]